VRKIAAMAEIHGVKTAWHGPGDVSPIGHAANVTLDALAGGLPRLPGDEEWLPLRQGRSWMGQ
jgi:mannonate dehydratase